MSVRILIVNEYRHVVNGHPIFDLLARTVVLKESLELRLVRLRKRAGRDLARGRIRRTARVLRSGWGHGLGRGLDVAGPPDEDLLVGCRK